MKTRQQLFDTAVTGVIRQGRAGAGDEYCKYLFEKLARENKLDKQKPTRMFRSWYRSESADADVWEIGSAWSKRIPKGLRCVVGHLIRDDLYSPSLESWPADHPTVVEAIGGVAPEDLGMLRALQRAHDDMITVEHYQERRAFVAAFIERALDVARRFKLERSALGRIAS